jgi:hypothetical protein
MPLTVSFTTRQTTGLPEKITVTDTSTGSDAAVTGRRLYLRLANGAYLRPDGVTTDYITWPLADASLTVDVLARDQAVNVTVLWINASGAAVYSKSVLTLFTLYARHFLYNLTQGQTGNPVLVNDGSYWDKKGEIQTALDSAKNAVELAADIYGAQACLNHAQNIIDNAEYFFY